MRNSFPFNPILQPFGWTPRDDRGRPPIRGVFDRQETGVRQLRKENLGARGKPRKMVFPQKGVFWEKEKDTGGERQKRDSPRGGERNAPNKVGGRKHIRSGGDTTHTTNKGNHTTGENHPNTNQGTTQRGNNHAGRTNPTNKNKGGDNHNPAPEERGEKPQQHEKGGRRKMGGENQTTLKRRGEGRKPTPEKEVEPHNRGAHRC